MAASAKEKVRQTKLAEANKVYQGHWSSEEGASQWADSPLKKLQEAARWSRRRSSQSSSPARRRTGSFVTPSRASNRAYHSNRPSSPSPKSRPSSEGGCGAPHLWHLPFVYTRV